MFANGCSLLALKIICKCCGLKLIINTVKTFHLLTTIYCFQNNLLTTSIFNVLQEGMCKFLLCCKCFFWLSKCFNHHWLAFYESQFQLKTSLNVILGGKNYILNGLRFFVWTIPLNVVYAFKHLANGSVKGKTGTDEHPRTCWLDYNVVLETDKNTNIRCFNT